jgi:dihydrofolate reductase
MDVVCVAAVAENGVIGDGDRLPWHLPHESKRYRERVADDPVAIGRRTYELFDEKPGRVQVVLSRSEHSWDDSTARHASSVEEAISVAEAEGGDVLYVLGGRGIYELFLSAADRQLLSRVHGEYDGDVTYPSFDDADWTLADETDHDGYTLEEWTRTTGE